MNTEIQAFLKATQSYNKKKIWHKNLLFPLYKFNENSSSLKP